MAWGQGPGCCVAPCASEHECRGRRRAECDVSGRLTLFKACHHHRSLEGGARSCRALHHGGRRHPLAIHHRAGAAARRGGTIAADANAHAPAAGSGGRCTAGRPRHGVALLRLLRRPLRRPSILHRHQVLPQAAAARQRCAAAAAGLRRPGLCQPGCIVAGRQGPHRRLSGPRHRRRRSQTHRPGGPNERPADIMQVSGWSRVPEGKAEQSRLGQLCARQRPGSRRWRRAAAAGFTGRRLACAARRCSAALPGSSWRCPGTAAEEPTRRSGGLPARSLCGPQGLQTAVRSWSQRKACEWSCLCGAGGRGGAPRWQRRGCPLNSFPVLPGVHMPLLLSV